MSGGGGGGGGAIGGDTGYGSVGRDDKDDDIG